MHEPAIQTGILSVGLLAVRALYRQKPVRSSSIEPRCFTSAQLRFGLVATLFAIAAGSQFVNAAEWQSTTSITSAAEAYIQEHYGSNDRRLMARAAPLDRRLQLHQCENSLEAFVRDGTKVNGRAVVGVRCTGPKPWKVYIPVDIVITESVLVAKKTLPKGHLLTAADVIVEQRNVSRMHSGYLSDVTEMEGYKLKHQIDGGRVLAPTMLTAQIVVRRGQSVTLIVNNDQISISMAGKALSDRALNQRIRVENLASGRIVEGIVRSAEQVEVLVR